MLFSNTKREELKQAEEQARIMEDCNQAREILKGNGVNPDELDKIDPQASNFLIWLQRLQNHSTDDSEDRKYIERYDITQSFLFEIKNRMQVSNKADLFLIYQNCLVLEELKAENKNLEKQNQNLEKLNQLLGNFQGESETDLKALDDEESNKSSQDEEEDER